MATAANQSKPMDGAGTGRAPNGVKAIAAELGEGSQDGAIVERLNGAHIGHNQFIERGALAIGILLAIGRPRAARLARRPVGVPVVWRLAGSGRAGGSVHLVASELGRPVSVVVVGGGPLAWRRLLLVRVLGRRVVCTWGCVQISEHFYLFGVHVQPLGQHNPVDHLVTGRRC